ncbi:MAG TPA: MFS transporter [Planctomycetota bacterium]|jgi:MFS family permease|nr:MFS transporter [Planctomycetota bacterium]
MANAKRLLWAGFMAILAAGVGFAIRNGILDNWGREFGFTGGQLGDIMSGAFTGFCFGIIIGGVIADKIGYGKLVIAAFALHVLSAVITFAASPAAAGATPDQVAAAKGTAFQLLKWGMFIFSLANGTLEAVANPLVATLFPQNRTHYLNILHASWPAGMVLGTVAGWILDDKMEVGWKIQLALYLVPTVIYGIMFLGQPMPKSEASEKGLSLAEMFKDVGVSGGLVACYLLVLFFSGSVFGGLVSDTAAKVIGYGIGGALLIAVGIMTKFSVGSILLFALFVAHALVGAVELGTDGWIQNITGNIFTSEQGRFLFIITSGIMFALRFCAHFIEKKLGLSPVGILVVCAILACIGLNLTSAVNTFFMAVLALSVYAVGKTFFWPTMLAVASDRFPRTGAVAISMMGGIGMLSAGLIGAAGLGYAKDRFTAEELQKTNPAVYAEVKADKPSKFLFFAEATGPDGKKLGDAQKKLGDARTEVAKAGQTEPKAAFDKLSQQDRVVVESDIKGSRKTLVADSVIPALMAIIYLAILLYFKTIGGYKPVTISEPAAGTSPMAVSDRS